MVSGICCWFFFNYYFKVSPLLLLLGIQICTELSASFLKWCFRDQRTNLNWSRDKGYWFPEVSNDLVLLGLISPDRAFVSGSFREIIQLVFLFPPLAFHMFFCFKKRFFLSYSYAVVVFYLLLSVLASKIMVFGWIVMCADQSSRFVLILRHAEPISGLWAS